MAGWPFFVYPDFANSRLNPPDRRLHPFGVRLQAAKTIGLRRDSHPNVVRKLKETLERESDLRVQVWLHFALAAAGHDRFGHVNAIVSLLNRALAHLGDSEYHLELASESLVALQFCQPRGDSTITVIESIVLNENVDSYLRAIALETYVATCSNPDKSKSLLALMLISRDEVLSEAAREIAADLRG